MTTGDASTRPNGHAEATQAPTVIPSQDTLIADLLSLDLSAPAVGVPSHGLLSKKIP